MYSVVNLLDPFFLFTMNIIRSARNRYQSLHSFHNCLNHLFFRCQSHVSSSPLQSIFNNPNTTRCLSNLNNGKIATLDLLNHTHFKITDGFIPNNLFSYLNTPIRTMTSRSYRRRKNCRKPKVLSDFPHRFAEYQHQVAKLPPRFTSEDLFNALNLQDDPLVCLELFNHASQQPRFRHDVSTYHLTIKKLGTAELYEEMDSVVDQVLAVTTIGSEALFNTIIYFYTEARRLSKAVNVYKHMRKNLDLSCRPSIRTYNLLFTAFLSKRNNSLINHMYMETIRCLFKQMVNDGVEPDIISLNSMIKGYILSLHVNDALRIFHQMGVVYSCQPDTHSYSYLIHGLCCQGRTNNAKEFYKEMQMKGLVPSSKAYNSLGNCLAMCGEIEEAARILWEMNEARKPVDFITYRTVLDEMCRQGKVAEAIRLLKELQEKDIVDGLTYMKLLYVVEDDFGNSNGNSNVR